MHSFTDLGLSAPLLRALARAGRLLERGENADAVLESFSRGLRKKMMHPFLHALHSEQPDRRELAAACLRELLVSGDAAP